MAVDGLSTLLQGLRARDAFDDEAAKLDASQPEKTSMALAAMCMLVNHAANQVSDSLPGVLPKLQELLSVSEYNVQASKLLELLMGGASDATLQLNALNALNSVAQAGEAGAQQIIETSGLQKIVPLCTCTDERVVEAAADLICQLSTNPPLHEAIRAAGTVPVLGELLGNRSWRIRVRAAVGLGMLTTKDTQSQEQLAATPNALHHLLVLMRQDKDMDCKIIARDLVSLLARSPSIKQQIADTMRSMAPST